MNEPLTLTVKVDPESLGLLDQFQYLVHFVRYCLDVYEVDPGEDFGINDTWREKTGKEAPSFE